MFWILAAMTPHVVCFPLYCIPSSTWKWIILEIWELVVWSVVQKKKKNQCINIPLHYVVILFIEVNVFHKCDPIFFILPPTGKKVCLFHWKKVRPYKPHCAKTIVQISYLLAFSDPLWYCQVHTWSWSSLFKSVIKETGQI